MLLACQNKCRFFFYYFYLIHFIKIFVNKDNYQINNLFVGFAIGSLIGGILYKEFGGALTMRIYATLAVLTSVAYLIMHLAYLKHAMPETGSYLEFS